NGGAFVLPIVHDVIPVNMNTLRLEVSRGRDKALITRDRMRVDVIAEFYVRVQASVEAISAAAQTLGQRTMQPDSLKELLEGKFVDALRTVAAAMTMEELHERRGEYVRGVAEAVAADLLQNGLELESASLTQLDQTAMEFFNPSNAFDAEGLTRLAEQQRAIAVAEQSKAQSEAQAAADRARALAASEEEKVFTARETEMASRRKAIELIGAAQEAERDSLRLRVAAEAERLAADDRG